MNKMTNLKKALDIAFAGQRDAHSKYRLVGRTYDEKSNTHKFTLTYTVKNMGDVPVESPTTKRDHRRDSLYKQIMKSVKIQSEK